MNLLKAMNTVAEFRPSPELKPGGATATYLKGGGAAQATTILGLHHFGCWVPVYVYVGIYR